MNWVIRFKQENMNKKTQSKLEQARAQGAGLNLLTVILRAKCREVEGMGCLDEGPYIGFALDHLWFIFLKSPFIGETGRHEIKIGA